MMATLGCMRAYLTRVMFAVLLGGIALGGAVLLEAGSTWAGDTTSQVKPETSTTKKPVPNATYDESQPGADDPRVKEGFAVYKAGDFKKAYDIWLPLAEAGNAEAQFRVGRLYSFGEGRGANFEEAIKWYESAAVLGHTIAMHNLAYILKIGRKAPQNIPKAIKYYTLAAESGYVVSQFGLGITFATVESPYRDFGAAYKWLYISMKNGHGEAMDTIRDLNRFASAEDRNAGVERMREWFKSHPR